MKKYQEDLGRDLNQIEINFLERLNERTWAFIKTMVDVVREPVLILNKDFRVMMASDSFYRMFQVEASYTEHKRIYELGNGQWDIPALRELLEKVLPINTFFKDFEVTHEFPFIGRKTMILNARQINPAQGPSDPIIFLAIEDNTSIMTIAETLASHVKGISTENAGRTLQLEMFIDTLEGEITEIKKRHKGPQRRSRRLSH